MADTPILNDGSSKPVKTTNVPLADIDFGSVVNKVKDKWNISAWLTLQYITYADFEPKAEQYITILNTRINYGKNRPKITNDIKLINKEIDSKISNVKGYIADKYGKENAISYYPSFGIEHYKKSYIIPKDQNSRSEALDLMVKAIIENDFIDKTYGKTYWEDIKVRFDALLLAASQLDSSVSNAVGDKNILKKELKKILNSIVLIIKANYPENYKQELRTWGFQKEKY
jgi:hypothetical protein